MRFDFDPENETEQHPLVHLHMNFEDTRISVHAPLCFTAFIKKIFRTFYFKEFVAQPDIADLHENVIDHDEGRYEPMSHCFQLSWQ